MRANQVTMQREEALKEVDVTVIGHNAVQQAGIMAQRGTRPVPFCPVAKLETDVSLLCFVCVVGHTQATTRAPGCGSP
jgi:hypothetical protein